MIGKVFLLKELKKGKSLRTIAKEKNVAYATVKYWKDKYNLDISKLVYTKKCSRCGKFLRGQQREYCSRLCKNRAHGSSKENQVTQNKRCLNRKIFLVNLLGGKCSKCGYHKNLTALCFHHKKNKKFPLNSRHLTSHSIGELLKEVNKCILLCNNCHAELHNPKFNDLLKKKK